MEEADAQALLGSPSVLGVGYLLAQQKERLGVKVIESVTVFGAEGAVELCLWIGDGEYVGVVDGLRTESKGELAEGAERGAVPSEGRFNHAEVGVVSNLTSPILPEIYLTWRTIIRKRFSKAAGKAWSALRLW